MTIKLQDMGAEIDRLQFFSQLTGAPLSAEQQEVVTSIMNTLPQGATIGDFIEVCKSPLPQVMNKGLIYANTWLPKEQLDLVKPLLEALKVFAQPGQYDRFFQVEDCPEIPVSQQ